MSKIEARQVYGSEDLQNFGCSLLELESELESELEGEEDSDALSRGSSSLVLSDGKLFPSLNFVRNYNNLQEYRYTVNSTQQQKSRASRGGWGSLLIMI